MNPPSEHSSPSGARILVIFPGALGDLICLIPALRALGKRHRPASIELMAREDLARFAVRRMGIDRAHSIDRREVSLLFSESADSTSYARGFFGDFEKIYSFFAGGNRRFRESLNRVSAAEVSFHPFRPDGAGRVAAAYLRSLNDATAPFESWLSLLPCDLDAASRRLGDVGLIRGNFVVLFPGSGSIGKNWPPEKFAALAESLQTKMPVAIVLGPAEAGLEAFFAARSMPMFADLELGELAAVAAAASLFAGNDSGVSHLAASVGTPGVAIFGPTDPRRWRPLGPVAVIQHLPISELGVGEVADAAIRMLDRGAGVFEWGAVRPDCAYRQDRVA